MEYASCIWWQRTLRLWFVWNSISFSYCFGFYFILKFFLPDPFCSFRSLAVFFLAIKDLKWFDVHLVYYWFYFSFSSLTFLALGLYEGLHDAPLLLFFNSLLCDFFVVAQAQILIYLIAAIRTRCSRSFLMIITYQRKKGM
jgi:hypothetical protein